MARLTTDGGALVVRLVYDGPPRSGKTTSLRALADGMARTAVSPGETDGRTEYFDWLEYVGGSFDGIPIHCQILSVPGQPELVSRRRALLAEADAIVFVTHGSPEHLPEAASHLRSLRNFVGSRPDPRPGVIVQANHRDRPDALSLAELHDGLGLDGLPLVESVATENQGIREAFVLAVRLALDRTRELLKQGPLPTGPGETDDPAALLARLQSAEDDSPSEPVRQAPRGVAPHGVEESPRLPGSGAPGGWTWPSVDGRVVLHAASTPGAVPQRGRDGSWGLTARLATGVWRFHSAPPHEFARLDDAREELARWTQGHTPGFRRLSPNRCIALAETGWGTWRLWQVVRAEETWRNRLAAALRDAPPPGPPEEAMTELLRTCVARLLAARDAFRQEPLLPCRLEVIGEARDRPVYAGLLPPAGWTPSQEDLALAGAELVRREIGPLMEKVEGDRRRVMEERMEEMLAGLVPQA